MQWNLIETTAKLKAIEDLNLLFCAFVGCYEKNENGKLVIVKIVKIVKIKKAATYRYCQSFNLSFSLLLSSFVPWHHRVLPHEEYPI